MELKIRFKENWLTRKPLRDGKWGTMILCALLLLGSFLYWNGGDWMPASGEAVFNKHEYWRLWTTLFAHGDIGHVLANLFLFIPFSYYLNGYFSPRFFPLAGFFVGGLVNLLVLRTMPAPVQLVGVSGVVYWMGGAWMTLFLLIDRRESMQRRVIKVLGISAIVFLPETYKPEISYLCHFLGFGAGILSALVYYAFKREEFHNAEKIELIYDGPLWDEPYWEENLQ